MPSQPSCEHNRGMGTGWWWSRELWWARLRAHYPPMLRFLPRKRSQPELCANPEEVWVQKLMRQLDQRSASEKQSLGCRKNRGASKPGKKGKGSKGCKR